MSVVSANSISWNSVSISVNFYFPKWKKKKKVSIAKHLDLFAWKRSSFFSADKTQSSLACMYCGEKSDRHSMHVSMHEYEESKRMWEGKKIDTLFVVSTVGKKTQLTHSNNKNVALILFIGESSFFPTGKRTTTNIYTISIYCCDSLKVSVSHFFFQTYAMHSNLVYNTWIYVGAHKIQSNSIVLLKMWAISNLLRFEALFCIVFMRHVEAFSIIEVIC